MHCDQFCMIFCCNVCTVLNSIKFFFVCVCFFLHFLLFSCAFVVWFVRNIHLPTYVFIFSLYGDYVLVCVSVSPFLCLSVCLSVCAQDISKSFRFG